MAYVLGLTYAAKFEDRGGIGRRAPLLGLAALAIAVLLTWSGAPWLRSFLGGYAMWVQRAISLIRSGKPEKIRKAIGALMTGISRLDAMVVAQLRLNRLGSRVFCRFRAPLAAQSQIAGT